MKLVSTYNPVLAALECIALRTNFDPLLFHHIACHDAVFVCAASLPPDIVFAYFFSYTIAVKGTWPKL
jgi:hypothetical protein